MQPGVGKNSRLPRGSTSHPLAGAAAIAAPPSGASDLMFPLFSAGGFETGGFGTANRFTGPIADRGSLAEVCKAIGTRAQRGVNARAALGAKLRVDLTQPDGKTRSVYRTIGASSSYGGSSLVELVGLGDADSVASLSVTWPVS